MFNTVQKDYIGILDNNTPMNIFTENFETMPTVSNTFVPKPETPTFPLLENLFKEFSESYTISLVRQEFRNIYLQILHSLFVDSNHTSNIFITLVKTALTSIVNNCQNINELNSVIDLVNNLNALSPYYNNIMVPCYKLPTISTIANELINARQHILLQPPTTFSISESSD